MKINQINQTNTFKGYKNLISNTYTDITGAKFCYMAMELNNDTVNDLDTWTEIQKKLLKIDKPSKYLITYNTIDNNKEDSYICLNNYLLNESKKENERITLKAYSFLASLTKRISIANYHHKDKDLYLTLIELIKSLNKVFGDKTANFLSNEAVMRGIKHYKTADKINNQIIAKMNKHFKL